MRIATYRTDEATAVGLVRDEMLLPLSSLARDMTDLLARFGADPQALRQVVEQEGARREPVALADVELCPPLPRPGKIIGIGRNYGSHAKEGGLAAQEKPRIFLKPASAVSGPGSVVRRPEAVRKLDFEGELVAVVGSRLSSATPEAAAAAIAGYTVGNDLSARELQFDINPPQTSFAKGMDGFAAIGPWITTADELGTSPDLGIRTWVNGVLMQDGRTGDLIFPVADCLAYLSRYMVLDPGDLLFTGTPSGVGVFRDPPVFLEPGDVVRVEIDGIGRLETQIG